MLAVVTGVVLPALFVASGGFGVLSLAGSWRRHAGTFRRLQQELAACETAPAVFVSVAVQEVREFSPVAARRLTRPVRRVALRSNQRVLRAAA